MSYLLDKMRLIVSVTTLSFVLLFASCDRHKHSKHDEIRIIDISEPMVEKHAKKGIGISEEERKEIVSIIKSEGILNVSRYNDNND